MPYFNVELLWQSSLLKEFNSLTVGRIFRENSECLVVGGQDGLITVYNLPKKKDILKNVVLEDLIHLETKGGPIQSFVLHHVTKFGSIDLIVADSKGTLTFFSNKQILNKMTISEGCISSLAVDVDTAGNLSIVAGDSEGNIVGCLPHKIQWRLQCNDIASSNKDSTMATVTSLLPIKVSASSHAVRNYVLVTYSNQSLHVLQNGALVRSMEMPSTVQTMCAGYFCDGVDTSVPVSPHATLYKGNNNQQVVLATEDGRIFLMSNFILTLFADVKLTVTNMASCSNGKSVDVLFCCGNFNSLLMYQNGCLMRRIQTNDWLNSIQVLACREEGILEHLVYLGMLDGCIQCHKLIIH